MRKERVIIAKIDVNQEAMSRYQIVQFFSIRFFRFLTTYIELCLPQAYMPETQNN